MQRRATLKILAATAVAMVLLVSVLAAAGAPLRVEPSHPSSAPSAPVSAAAISMTPRLLASIAKQDNGLTASSNTTSFSFVFAENANGYAYDVGYKNDFVNGSAGTTNFTDEPGSYPLNFPKIAIMLADGIDQALGFASVDNNGSSTSSVAMESAVFGTSPDFLGARIDSVALVIHDLHIYSIGARSFEFANYTWQIWGHPYPVVLAPPTDADGAYVFDRNSETVNALLSSAPDSAPLLNWDGSNHTMQGSGTNWQLTMSNVANGVHSLKVYATIGGVVYSSEGATGRHITFGYHLWSQIPIAPGVGPGIALDANGIAHVCYQDASGSIVYAVRSTSGWMSQIVATGSHGGACDIVLDHEGRPHLLFGNLQHAFFNGATWSIDTISTNGVASNASMALNPLTDLPVVAWYHTLNHYLVVSNDTGATWQSSIADRPNTGLEPSLAVDANGVPNVAYFDALGNVHYANISASAGGWDVESLGINVAPVPGNGRISLALNATGRPHIVFAGGGPVYGTFGYRGIYYATWPQGSPAFVVQTINGTHAFIQGPIQAVSIAMDSSNNPEIAFSLVGTPTPPSGVLTDLGFASFGGQYWSTSLLSHVVGSGSVRLVLTPWGAPEVVTSLTSGPNGSGLYWFASNAADREPPVTTATLSGTMGQSGYYVSAVTVTLAATDDITGVASTYSSVDNGSWTPYSSPVVVSADGAHTVRYYSVDSVGNAEATKSVSFSISTGGPTTTAAVAGTAGHAGWYVSPVTITLSASGGSSGVASTRYRVDNGTWQTYAAPFTVGEGKHSVDYYSTNAAGIDGPTATSYVDIDLTAPTVSFQISGVETAGWYNSSVTLGFTAQDALSGPASVSVSVNGGAWQTTSGSTASPTLSQNGVNNVSYYATDQAGNAGTAETLVVKIDTMAPTTTAQVTGTLGTSNWYTSNASVVLTATESLSGVALTRYREDSGPWQTYGTAIVVHDGVHTFSYYSVAVAGNTEATHSMTVRVDATPPLVGITSPIGIVTASQVTIVWTGSDPISGIVGYAIDVDGQGFTSVGNVTQVTVGLQDGAHTITVRATDGAGNTAVAVTHISVSTNAFSFSGPYGGWPTIALIVVAALAIGVLALWYRSRRRQRKPPEKPKEEPEPESEL